MRKLILTALCLISFQVSAVDFSSRTNKDLLSKKSTISLVAGQEFKSGARVEILMNSVGSKPGAADTVGFNLAAPLLKYERVSVKMKTGLTENIYTSVIDARIGFEFGYQVGDNKKFVFELTDKFDPITKERANKPSISTGMRFSF